MSATSLAATATKSDVNYKCRHCLAYGHLQNCCTKRIAAKATMLDKNRKPCGNGVTEVNAQEGEGSYLQQNCSKKHWVPLYFRALNANPVDDKYTMRTIEDCLAVIGYMGSTIFTSLDLIDGFNQPP
jgi:hypothetical protein